MFKYLIPLILFLVLAGFLYVGLGLKPKEVPSPFIGKPAPAFELPQLHDPNKTFGTADMKGQVWMLNVWASWCVSCRYEHPYLVQLHNARRIPIYGLNYKDKQNDARHWLREDGNPYLISAVDESGKVGIDYGVYGVPESYIIDKNGIIVHKVTGPLNPDNLQNCVLPLMDMLTKAPVDKQVTREVIPACA